MNGNPSGSFCGEDVIWPIHLVAGEPLSKGTAYHLCRHKNMLQWSNYTKTDFHEWVSNVKVSF